VSYSEKLVSGATQRFAGPSQPVPVQDVVFRMFVTLGGTTDPEDGSAAHGCPGRLCIELFSL
jgi:hypothetical protein